MKDIKDLLGGYSSTQAELEGLQLHRNDLTAFFFPDGNAPEEAKGRLLRIQNKREEYATRLKQELDHTLKIIGAMKTDKYKTVLALRYIRGLSWKEIGELTKYSEDYLRGKMLTNAIKEAKEAQRRIDL